MKEKRQDGILYKWANNMNETDKDVLANRLIMQNLISYLIKTGVIDEADYIEHTQTIKFAALQSIENIDEDNQSVSRDFIRSVFDKHLAELKPD